MLSERQPLLADCLVCEGSEESDPSDDSDIKASFEANEDDKDEDHHSHSDAESDDEKKPKVPVHFFKQKRSRKHEEVHELDVTVFVRVDSITIIDLAKQSFTGDLWLFLITPLKGLDFHTKSMIEDFFHSFQPTKHKDHWGAIQNLVTASETNDHPIPHAYDDGTMFGLTWRLCGEFAEAWELDRFPFDCQDLTASIMIRYPSKHLRMHFVRDNNYPSAIRDKTFPSLDRTWEFPERLLLWSKTIDKGGSRNDATTRQILNVTLEVRRNPGYYVWNVVVPMCMIVIMSGSAFFPHPEEIQDRLAACLTLVLTAVAYKYNVVQTVPPIGYNTWLDWYGLMCYLFIFLVVVENCAAYVLLQTHGDEPQYQGRKWEFPFIFPLVAGFFLCNWGFLIRALFSRYSHSRLSQKKLEKKNNELPLASSDTKIPISPRSGRSQVSTAG